MNTEKLNEIYESIVNGNFSQAIQQIDEYNTKNNNDFWIDYSNYLLEIDKEKAYHYYTLTVTNYIKNKR